MSTTSYTRSPRTKTVHCPLCKWLRTVFDDATKHKSLEARAKYVLNAHMRIHKRKGPVLINGR